MSEIDEQEYLIQKTEEAETLLRKKEPIKYVLAGNKDEFNLWCQEEGEIPGHTAILLSGLSKGVALPHVHCSQIRVIGSWRQNPMHDKDFWAHLDALVLPVGWKLRQPLTAKRRT